MDYLLYWFATYGVLMFITTFVVTANEKAYIWITENPAYVYPSILLVSTLVSIFHKYI